jgi:hypothetical protein
MSDTDVFRSNAGRYCILIDAPIASVTPQLTGAAGILAEASALSNETANPANSDCPPGTGWVVFTRQQETTGFQDASFTLVLY